MRHRQGRLSWHKHRPFCYPASMTRCRDALIHDRHACVARPSRHRDGGLPGDRPCVRLATALHAASAVCRCSLALLCASRSCGSPTIPMPAISSTGCRISRFPELADPQGLERRLAGAVRHRHPARHRHRRIQFRPSAASTCLGRFLHPRIFPADDHHHQRGAGLDDHRLLCGAMPLLLHRRAQHDAVQLAQASWSSASWSCCAPSPKSSSPGCLRRSFRSARWPPSSRWGCIRSARSASCSTR